MQITFSFVGFTISGSSGIGGSSLLVISNEITFMYVQQS